LKIYPQEHYLTWRQDIHGNFLARVNLPTPTEYLKIEVDIIAYLKPINPFDFLLEDYVINYPFAYCYQEQKELAAFLEITESGKMLQEWVEIHRQKDIYTINFVSFINGELAKDISHIIRLEEGIWSCEETLSRKMGSCRDSAWLLVQILRHYGLAARFVSGYLIQLKPDIPPLDGSTILEEDTAGLHAWTEVYLPGAGWIGLDPTSGMLTTEGHIPLVSTPEPSAASPVRGSSEPCESELDFTVIVSRHQ
jgi:transglutaminase-like putative cysteine protease